MDPIYVLDLKYQPALMGKLQHSDPFTFYCLVDLDL